MKYRKKPVVIEALQWTEGDDQVEGPAWIVEAINAGAVGFENMGGSNVVMLIHTLEGVMQARRGDWIIRGIQGELYPCKPDIFKKTYEPIEDSGEAYRAAQSAPAGYRLQPLAEFDAMRSQLTTVDDLAALVARLARVMRKANVRPDLTDSAMDYLNRKGIAPSPLRRAEASDRAVAASWERFKAEMRRGKKAVSND